MQNFIALTLSAFFIKATTVIAYHTFEKYWNQTMYVLNILFKSHKPIRADGNSFKCLEDKKKRK